MILPLFLSPPLEEAHPEAPAKILYEKDCDYSVTMVV